jgi:hypothetical protein
LLKKFSEHNVKKAMANLDHSMSKEETLYRLLVKERGFYQAIKDLTRQEAEQWAGESPEAASSLLKKKKILMECIQEVEDALTPLKKYWNQKADRSDFFSQQIECELATLNGLLKEILEMDLASQRALKNRMRSLQEKTKPGL